MLRTIHDSIKGIRGFKGLTAGGTAIHTPNWACGALIRNHLLVMARLNPWTRVHRPGHGGVCGLGAGVMFCARLRVPGSRTTLRTLIMVAPEILGTIATSLRDGIGMGYRNGPWYKGRS